MLAVSDALALAGFATVAIDMPLHGVGSANPFYQAGKERTFDVDFGHSGYGREYYWHLCQMR